MKKYLILIFLLVFVSSAYADTGLMAFYPFSGNSNDESGNKSKLGVIFNYEFKIFDNVLAEEVQSILEVLD